MFSSYRQATVVLSYLAILVLQPVWHFLLPAPHGAGHWWLALATAAPLLIPLKGVVNGNLRSMTWGGYLLVFYLAAGIMEAWANPEQRVPALLQTSLAALYIISLLLFSREKP